MKDKLYDKVTKSKTELRREKLLAIMQKALNGDVGAIEEMRVLHQEKYPGHFISKPGMLDKSTNSRWLEDVRIIYNHLYRGR